MEVSLEHMGAYAKEFVEELPKMVSSQAHVVGLKGDLGAGKTTFVQHVARELGVTGSVTSPTFVVAQSYETQHPVFTRLVHMDAYRLEGEEKDTIGFEEFVKDPNTLLFVEWPEKLPYMVIFPADAPTISFAVVGENVRSLTYA